MSKLQTPSVLPLTATLPVTSSPELAFKLPANVVLPALFIISLSEPASISRILKIPLSLCKELTPNIEQNCKSSFLASVFYNGGGSATWDYYYIYGLFNIDGISKIIPLKSFPSARLARNFVDEWEENR